MFSIRHFSRILVQTTSILFIAYRYCIGSLSFPTLYTAQPETPHYIEKYVVP